MPSGILRATPQAKIAGRRVHLRRPAITPPAGLGVSHPVHPVHPVILFILSIHLNDRRRIGLLRKEVSAEGRNRK